MRFATMFLKKACPGCLNGAFYGEVGFADNADIKSLTELFACFSIALGHVKKEGGFTVLHAGFKLDSTDLWKIKCNFDADKGDTEVKYGENCIALTSTEGHIFTIFLIFAGMNSCAELHRMPEVPDGPGKMIREARKIAAVSVCVTEKQVKLKVNVEAKVDKLLTTPKVKDAPLSKSESKALDTKALDRSIISVDDSVASILEGLDEAIDPTGGMTQPTDPKAKFKTGARARHDLRIL